MDLTANSLIALAFVSVLHEAHGLVQGVDAVAGADRLEQLVQGRL